MLVFDGINPYHIPQQYMSYAWYAMLFGWITYQLAKVVLDCYRDLKELKERHRRETEELDRLMAERIAEIARRNKELREKWGFRDPVIVTQKMTKRVPKKGSL